jgi:hypothetical protein
MSNNPLQLPAGQYLDGFQRAGMTRLPRSYVVRNEIGGIEIEDNGTSIPAWSAAGAGVLVGFYGKRYELVE